MRNTELDYEVPVRALVWAWLVAAGSVFCLGVWRYGVLVMLVFSAAALLWINLYSTVLHYTLDTEAFAQLPVVGAAFVRFQSHHFPQWINVIYRKPVLDLVGELNPMAVLMLGTAVVFFGFRSPDAYVTWGVLLLASGYAMLGHRWAHEPAATKPRIATYLQQYRLSLSPTAHWEHHAQAVRPGGGAVQNYDLSFGWSNAVFNRMMRVVPDPRVWFGFIFVTTFGQIPAFVMLLRWLHR